MHDEAVMSARVLVVYYSRTGTTKRVAGAIAAAVGGDLEEISDRTKRTGLLGYLRSGYEAARRRQIPIGPAIHDPSTYDLVIVGTPIWDMSVSSPVRSYLHRHRAAFRKVAFFCTCGGRGGARAFAEMSKVCAAEPIATLVLREREVLQAAAPISRFAAEIHHALLGAPAPAAPGARPAATEPARGPMY